MKTKRHSLFLKYLISYTIMFMLPTLVLAFFINNVLLENLRTQYLKTSRDSLLQINATLNQDFIRLSLISEHILVNQSIRPTHNLDNVNSAINIIQELRKYVISNNCVRELALYFHGDNFVYSSQASSTLDRFVTESYIFSDNASVDKFMTLLTSESEDVMPYQDISILGINRNLLTMVKQVKIAGKKASLVFFLDDYYPQSLRDDGIYIFDDNNVMLREFDPNMHFDEALITQQLNKAFENGESYTTLGNVADKLFALIVDDPNLGGHVVRIGNDEAIFGDFVTVQILFWILLFVVILISVIFTAVNMASNYNPLRKLSKTAYEIYGKEQRAVHDEYNNITNTITYLFNENNKIRSQSEPAIKASFLLQLLKGRIATQEEFEHKAQELDMQRLCGEKLFVLICCFKGKDNDFDALKVENIISTQLNGYCREHTERNAFVFVGSLPQKQIDKMPYCLLNLHALLCKASEQTVTVAASSLHDAFNEIPTAFIEASLAFDYGFVKGWNNIIEYSELVLNDHMGAAYPQQLFDKLNYRIKSGTPDQISLALDNIIAYIKNTDLPLYYAKGLCYQLINNVSVIIQELGEMAHVSQNPLSYATILAEFETADELVVAVKNICLNICDYIRESAEIQKTGNIQDIKKYIENTCLDINFSIQTVSDEYNMSLSSLSVYFKSSTGENISDFATAVRMKRAKEILLKGDMPLAKIAEEVGYMSASSFIRRFKTMYGITPGQFVQLNKKKD